MASIIHTLLRGEGLTAMAILAEWIRRLAGSLRAGRRDRSSKQELQAHLELAAEAARRRGLSAGGRDA